MTLIAQSCRRRPWVWGGGLIRPSVEQRLSASWERCRPSHANGAVAEEIDSIKHLSRITTWFYIALYAFIVHDRRLVRVALVHGQPAVVSRRTRRRWRPSCTASLVLMRVVPAAA